jgi:hypothetical protein
MNDRRSFFGRLASAGAGLLAGKQALAAYAPPEPVEMPDLKNLPHRMVDGVKEFHLVATVVRTEFVPGRPVDAWGFNGTSLVH